MKKGNLLAHIAAKSRSNGDNTVILKAPMNVLVVTHWPRRKPLPLFITCPYVYHCG